MSIKDIANITGITCSLLYSRLRRNITINLAADPLWIDPADTSRGRRRRLTP